MNMPQSITSKENPACKRVVKLSSDASHRKAQGVFVIEGLRLCYDAALSGIEIQETYFTREAGEKSPEELGFILSKAKESHITDSRVFAKMSDTKSPQGIICVCGGVDLSYAAEKIDGCGKYIALEQISDPANLGAIARTAEALGLSGMIIQGGCDIWNPKTLRASMGAFFRLPVIKTDDMTGLIRDMRTRDMLALACVADSDAEDIRDIGAIQKGIIAVIGNEANGISPALSDACDLRVTIPMTGRAESLNAAAAAAIVIWEIRC